MLAAIEAQATHLITGDVRRFGPYFGKKIQSILILTPSESSGCVADITVIALSATS